MEGWLSPSRFAAREMFFSSAKTTKYTNARAALLAELAAKMRAACDDQGLGLPIEANLVLARRRMNPLSDVEGFAPVEHAVTVGRSKLLRATLPLVTRMFLLGHHVMQRPA